MKITKRQLRRIIKEMHPRAAADDAYVAELERDELATQIRHASKDIYGTKDHYDLRGKSVEELEDILYDLANSQEQRYLDDEARTEMDDEMGYDSELSRAEMAPRRQGMRRRPGGSKAQRRMEGKLRSFISESMEELPPPGADRKPSTSTDALILVDQIGYAVQDGLEELGVTAEQADEIVRQLENRPDMLKEALKNGLYDYKRKLGMTGKPKPRSV